MPGVCFRCKQWIEDGGKSAAGRRWHAECYWCDSCRHVLDYASVFCGHELLCLDCFTEKSVCAERDARCCKASASGCSVFPTFLKKPWEKIYHSTETEGGVRVHHFAPCRGIRFSVQPRLPSSDSSPGLDSAASQSAAAGGPVANSRLRQDLGTRTGRLKMAEGCCRSRGGRRRRCVCKEDPEEKDESESGGEELGDIEAGIKRMGKRLGSASTSAACPGNRDGAGVGAGARAGASARGDDRKWDVRCHARCSASVASTRALQPPVRGTASVPDTRPFHTVRQCLVGWPVGGSPVLWRPFSGKECWVQRRLEGTTEPAPSARGGSARPRGRLLAVAPCLPSQGASLTAFSRRSRPSKQEQQQPQSKTSSSARLLLRGMPSSTQHQAPPQPTSQPALAAPGPVPIYAPRHCVSMLRPTTPSSRSVRSVQLSSRQTPLRGYTVRPPPPGRCPCSPPTPPPRRPGLGRGPLCRRCGKAVYYAERILASGGVFHNTCFSCRACRKPLEVINMYEGRGEVFCKPCGMKKFGPVVYGYGRGPGALQSLR